MSTLRQAAADYLAMRRALGYKLSGQGQMLMSFIMFMDAAGREVITTEAAVEWAAHPPRSSRPGGGAGGWRWCACSPATCMPSTRPIRFRRQACCHSALTARWPGTAARERKPMP